MQDLVMFMCHFSFIWEWNGLSQTDCFLLNHWLFSVTEIFKVMLSGLDLFTADYLVGFCPFPDRWGRWCCPVQWTPRRGTGIHLHSSHPSLFDLLCTCHQPLARLDSHRSVWPSGTGTCPSLQLSVHNTHDSMLWEELLYSEVQQDMLTSHIPQNNMATSMPNQAWMESWNHLPGQQTGQVSCPWQEYLLNLRNVLLGLHRPCH